MLGKCKKLSYELGKSMGKNPMQIKHHASLFSSLFSFIFIDKFGDSVWGGGKSMEGCAYFKILFIIYEFYNPYNG